MTHSMLPAPTNATMKSFRATWLVLCGLLNIGTGVRAAQTAPDLGVAELTKRMAQNESSLALTVRAIETTVTAGNTKLLASLVDTDAVLNKATSDLGGADVATIRKIFCDGTKQAWQNNHPTSDYAGTLFRFLRVRTFHERTGLLFRSENENGCINYYLMIVGEPNPGEYRINDIYTFGLNEFASAGLRRTYCHLLASFSPSESASKFSPIGQIYVDHLQGIANLNRFIKEGKYAEAVSLYNTLPREVQTERGVMMLRIDAAEHISKEDRAAAMEAWIKVNPDEMNLPLKIADYYISENRWQDAKALLSKVVKAVGGDSRMQFQLGQVSYNSQSDGNWVKTAELETGTEAASKDDGGNGPLTK